MHPPVGAQQGHKVGVNAVPAAEGNHEAIGVQRRLLLPANHIRQGQAVDRLFGRRPGACASKTGCGMGMGGGGEEILPGVLPGRADAGADGRLRVWGRPLGCVQCIVALTAGSPPGVFAWQVHQPRQMHGSLPPRLVTTHSPARSISVGTIS